MIVTKDRYRQKLLQKPNVTSVGIGYKNGTGELCIVVGVSEKVPLKALRRRDRIPPKMGNYETDVVVKPPIKLLGRMDKSRPATPGASIGHVDITAGTFGLLVKDKDSDASYILSNNHVLANVNQAELGDAILQPGPADGGIYPDDHIAALVHFDPIYIEGEPTECQFAGGIEGALNWAAKLLGSRQRFKALATESNLFDAALAMPMDADNVTGEILELGIPRGRGDAILGASVHKSGRTTGTTHGTITEVNSTVQVEMGMGQMAVFEDQVFSDILCEGGDSGSAILDDNDCVVGLLFAGGGGFTVFNRIEHILDAYNVTVFVN